MYFSDEPLEDFERHEREQAKLLAQLPECTYCGEAIQGDYYYEINDEVICEECLNSFFRKENSL